MRSGASEAMASEARQPSPLLSLTILTFHRTLVIENHRNLERSVAQLAGEKHHILYFLRKLYTFDRTICLSSLHTDTVLAVLTTSAEYHQSIADTYTTHKDMDMINKVVTQCTSLYKKNSQSIHVWGLFFIGVLVVFMLLSSGDFSFLLVS